MKELAVVGVDWRLKKFDEIAKGFTSNAPKPGRACSVNAPSRPGPEPNRKMFIRRSSPKSPSVAEIFRRISVPLAFLGGRVFAFLAKN
jgi:hypothetical protein